MGKRQPAPLHANTTGLFADSDAHVKVVAALWAKHYSVEAIARATGLAEGTVKKITDKLTKRGSR